MDIELYTRDQMPLAEQEQAALETLGHPIRRGPEQPFFLEGEAGDFVLLLRKGHVKVLRGTPPRIIDVRGPGDVVGDLAVLRGLPRMASVVAFDEVEALYLPGVRWMQFLYEHPRAMHALLISIGDMADRATKKNVESELAIEQQLAKRIMELVDMGLGEPAGDGGVLLRLSQHDVATLIGAKKLDSVKKIIRLLKAAGIVDTGRQAITIPRPAELREVADGLRTVS